MVVVVVTCNVVGEMRRVLARWTPMHKPDVGGGPVSPLGEGRVGEVRRVNDDGHSGRTAIDDGVRVRGGGVMVMERDCPLRETSESHSHMSRCH